MEQLSPKLGIFNDAAPWDSFGSPVALHGDIAAVAAGGDDDRGNDAGAIFVFQRSGTVWSVSNKITAPGAIPMDWLCSSLAMDGGTIVAGSSYSGSSTWSTPGAGAAYIYTRSGSSWPLSHRLTASDGNPSDQFGNAIDLDGNKLVIGAANDSDHGDRAGSAYIFTRSGKSWSQSLKLSAADPSKQAHFGSSVSFDGNALLVGAKGAKKGKFLERGAGYVFVKNGTTWIQQAKLTALNSIASHSLGDSAALQGDTALLGNIGDNLQGSRTGAVYVFRRSGTTWWQSQKITAPDKAQDAFFGMTVALDARTAVIGTRGNNNNLGAAYLFVRTGSSWSFGTKLTSGAIGDRLGYMVALAGETVLSGAIGDSTLGKSSGAAYVWARVGSSWPLQQKIHGQGFGVSPRLYFGYALSSEGNRALVGAYGDSDRGYFAGAAFLFQRSGSSWSQSVKLTALDGGEADRLGHAVDLVGDTVLAGAYQDDSLGDGAGAAYIFSRVGTGWYQMNKLQASSGAALDYFGISVDLDTGQAYVGAHGDDTRGSMAGAAYMFTGAGSTWNQQQKLTAADGAAEDWFGWSGSVAGNTALVGAYGDDDRGSASGSAHLFTRIGTNWSAQAKLTAADGAAGDYFGWSLGRDGDTAIIGARGDDDAAQNAGSAYIFFRSGTTWSQQAKLTATDGDLEDNFGYAVSVSGDIATVGARGQDGPGKDAGAVYLFSRSGTTWHQQVKVSPPKVGADDAFGHAVAMTGKQIFVGAPQADMGNLDTGAVYTFSATGTSLGLPCAKGGDCLGGFCVDGVCCQASCGGGVKGDCQACSVKAGAAKDGSCSVLNTGTICRAKVGACDLPEACNGVHEFCPLDRVTSAATVCRASLGSCDIAESCDGVGKVCPMDKLKVNSVVCRQAAGACDKVELCTGASVSCPTDQLHPASQVCRASAGPCDVQEQCTGKGTKCPANLVRPASHACRKATGLCDLTETCTGSSPLCPTDVKQKIGVVCRSSQGTCDLVERCNGTSAKCPADVFKPVTTECRAATGECDVVEACLGTSWLCPKDLHKPSGTPCLSGSGQCSGGMCKLKPDAGQVDAAVDMQADLTGADQSADHDVLPSDLPSPPDASGEPPQEDGGCSYVSAEPSGHAPLHALLLVFVVLSAAWLRRCRW